MKRKSKRMISMKKNLMTGKSRHKHCGGTRHNRITPQCCHLPRICTRLITVLEPNDAHSDITCYFAVDINYLRLLLRVITCHLTDDLKQTRQKSHETMKQGQIPARAPSIKGNWFNIRKGLSWVLAVYWQLAKSHLGDLSPRVLANEGGGRNSG